MSTKEQILRVVGFPYVLEFELKQWKSEVKSSKVEVIYKSMKHVTKRFEVNMKECGAFSLICC